MDVNVKYKRWGWGAVIGLIGVILIAGLIVAVSMSSPKPNNDLAASTGDGPSTSQANGTTNAEKQSDAEKKAEEEAKQKADAEKKAEEEKKAEAERQEAKEEAARREAEQKKAEEEAAATSTGSDLPHTGPVESFSAVIAFAAIAYLIALNISLVKKQTR